MEYVKTYFLLLLVLPFILPIQAELINAFQFTTFLFLVFFMIGSYQGKYKKLVFPVILILFIFLNVQTSYKFFILKLAYSIHLD
jgi:hypothetical protein